MLNRGGQENVGEEEDDEDELEASPGEQEREALIPQKAPFPVSNLDAKLDALYASRVPWTAIILWLLLFTAYVVIWSLPAPSFFSKVSLLRQSWHMSEVLQLPPKLKKELAAKEKDVQGLRIKVTEVQQTNGQMQARVDNSENSTRVLRKQLEDLHLETSKLKGEDGALRQRLLQEKNAQTDLELKLKKLKELELPLLNSIPDNDPPELT